MDSKKEQESASGNIFEQSTYEDDSLDTPPEHAEVVGVSPEKTSEPMRTPVQAPEDIDHELKFTGFEQPKEQGFWVWVNHHKTRSISLAIFAVVFVISGIVVLVSLNNDSSQDVAANAKKSTVSTKDQDEKANADTQQTASAPDITKSEFSLQNSAQTFDLVSDDNKVWLSRSELDWRSAVHWKSWLFFGANSSAQTTVKPGEAGYIVSLHAYNFDSKQFLEIGQITPPSDSTITNPMYVDTDYLYVPLQSLTGAGASYRCKLDEQKSCADLKLYYDKPGRLKFYDDKTVLVIQDVFDETNHASVLKLWNPTSGETKDVTTASSINGVGNTIAAISADKLVWIVETSADAGTQAGTNTVRVSKLFAVDFAGVTQLVLPSDGFPIAGSALKKGGVSSSAEIVFGNETQEVIFDTVEKMFKAPKARSTATNTEEKSAIRTIVELSSQLNLPEDYILRSRQ